MKLAEAYGMLGIRVTTMEEVEGAIRQAHAHPGPVLVEFLVEVEENVYPMIPSGESVKEMVEDTAPARDAVQR